MTTDRTMDISKLSVNLLLAASIIFGAIKLTAVGEDMVRDLDNLKTTIPAIREDAHASHADVEAVLRDGADQRARIKSLEEWKIRANQRYIDEWQFVHGRIDTVPWHHLRQPLPEVE